MSRLYVEFWTCDKVDQATQRLMKHDGFGNVSNEDIVTTMFEFSQRGKFRNNVTLVMDGVDHRFRAGVRYKIIIEEEADASTES